MKKELKWVIWIVVIGLVTYNSVFFRKLTEVKAIEKKFDALVYASELVNKKLPATYSRSIDVDQLFEKLKITQAINFEKYGKALTIGSTKYFLVKGNGKILSINESSVSLLTRGNNRVEVATEYVF